jgi:flagellar protein FlaF
MSYQAYQRTSARAEDPRSTEYRLLGQVTRALMEVQEIEPREIRKRAEALDWNRRVWSAFAADCANPDNGLPDALRASIISLSIFISKETSTAMRGGGDIETLIDLNRTVMQGLEPGAQAAAG